MPEVARLGVHVTDRARLYRHALPRPAQPRVEALLHRADPGRFWTADEMRWRCSRRDFIGQVISPNGGFDI
jgi:hypothetical protein